MYKHLAIPPTPILLCADTALQHCTQAIQTDLMINCIMVVHHTVCLANKTPYLHAVHINGKSRAIYKDFELQTHPFQDENRPGSTLSFRSILDTPSGHKSTHIQIIGGNKETEKGLHDSVVQAIQTQKMTIPIVCTHITNNAWFTAIIAPGEAPRCTLIHTGKIFTIAV